MHSKVMSNWKGFVAFVGLSRTVMFVSVTMLIAQGAVGVEWSGMEWECWECGED